MSRLNTPELDNAPQASQPILEAVRKQLGVVPNMFRLAANSPAALEGFTSNNGALAKALDVKTRERIALAVAQINGCDYCLSAHTYLGLNLAKLTPEEIALNRQGRSSDERADVAVQFASKLVTQRGSVSDADVEALREVGYVDKDIVEIIAVTAENIFTNYLNIAGGTELDFPAVRANELNQAA
ncbi:MAG: peroxidase-related enzyme [Alphaproteobacteria bacterium]|nr:peroxidase-related enzyme [Alphaproteobacteria bacterium]